MCVPCALFWIRGRAAMRNQLRRVPHLDVLWATMPRLDWGRRILVRAHALHQSLPLGPLWPVSSARAILCPALSSALHTRCMSMVIAQWRALLHVGLVRVRAWRVLSIRPVPEELPRGAVRSALPPTDSLWAPCLWVLCPALCRAVSCLQGRLNSSTAPRPEWCSSWRPAQTSSPG